MNTEVVCHSLLQRTTFCQTSPPWPVCLGWPHMAWLSFIELGKAVVLWSDWLVFCDCGFSLSAPWSPLPVPSILLGFLLPWTYFISLWLLQESAAEPEIQLPTSTGSSKKQGSSTKTSISALLTMPKPLTVWITINCGKFWKRWKYQTTWPASWETICRSGSNS